MCLGWNRKYKLVITVWAGIECMDWNKMYGLELNERGGNQIYGPKLNIRAGIQCTG